MGRSEEFEKAVETAHDFEASCQTHNFAPVINDLLDEYRCNPRHTWGFTETANQTLLRDGKIQQMRILGLEHGRIVCSDSRQNFLIDASGQVEAIPASELTHTNADGSVTAEYRQMQVTRFPQGNGIRPTVFTPAGRPGQIEDVGTLVRYAGGTSVCFDCQGRVVLTTDGQGHTQEFHYNAYGAADAFKTKDNEVFLLSDRQTGLWQSNYGRTFRGCLLGVDNVGSSHWADARGRQFVIGADGSCRPEQQTIPNRPAYPAMPRGNGDNRWFPNGQDPNIYYD